MNDVLSREPVAERAAKPAAFPLSAGILLGLGLGGFFDGIVLHQILQWHHMVSSAGYPPDSVDNLEFNTLLDGLFHAATYVFVLAGLARLWRVAQRQRVAWSATALIGSLLAGWGIFNLVEGVVNHQILSLHHVNERVPPAQWAYWDFGFLAFGIFLIALGALMVAAVRKRSV